MRNLRTWTAAFVVAGFGIAAQASAIGVQISATPASHYVWRGYDLLDGARYPFQPSLTVTGDAGLSANVWGSWAMKDRDDTKSADEIDFTISYDKRINEMVGLTAGGVCYAYPNAGESNTSELFAGVSFGTFLSPSLTLYYDTEWFDGESEASGWYALAGASHALPITESVGLSLGAGLGFGSNASFDGLQDFSASASSSFSVGPVSISPFVGATYVLEDSINDDDEAYGGLTIGWSR